MLRIYRRHRTHCPQTSERYRRCSCPIYVEGSLGGETIRKALDQTSWEAASDLIALWTAAGRIGAIRPDIPSIDKAIEKYLADAAARQLNAATLQKQKNLLERRLLGWTKEKGLRLLKQLDLPTLRDSEPPGLTARSPRTRTSSGCARFSASAIKPAGWKRIRPPR